MARVCVCAGERNYNRHRIHNTHARQRAPQWEGKGWVFKNNTQYSRCIVGQACGRVSHFGSMHFGRVIVRATTPRRVRETSKLTCATVTANPETLGVPALTTTTTTTTQLFTMSECNRIYARSSAPYAREKCVRAPNNVPMHENAPHFLDRSAPHSQRDTRYTRPFRHWQQL